MSIPSAHWQAFQEIVKSRRSIRLFTDAAVPPEVIQNAFDAALLAPNSSNLQPWEFLWVRSPILKAKLVKACLSQAAAATAAELVVCVARTGTWKEAQKDMLRQLEEHSSGGTRIPKMAWVYYRKLVPIVYQQGWLGSFGLLKRVAFFLIGLFKPVVRNPSSLQDMRIWATKSTALACENFVLACSAQGYDTCMMEGFDSRRVRSLFDLPADALPVMVLAIGQRRPEGVTLPRIRGDRARYVREV